MPWIAVAWIALILALVVVRQWILKRWARSHLTHRQAAALYAAVIPIAILIALLIQGIDSLGRALFVMGLSLFVFLPTYAFTLLMLRWFGGEMDPPSSPTYRRRL